MSRLCFSKHQKNVNLQPIFRKTQNLSDNTGRLKKPERFLPSSTGSAAHLYDVTFASSVALDNEIRQVERGIDVGLFERTTRNGAGTSGERRGQRGLAGIAGRCEIGVANACQAARIGKHGKGDLAIA